MCYYGTFNTFARGLIVKVTHFVKVQLRASLQKDNVIMQGRMGEIQARRAEVFIDGFGLGKMAFPA